MFFSLFARIKSGIRFKEKCFLRLSLALNLTYSVFLFAVSFFYDSKWLFVSSIYYILLFATRVFIVLKDKTEERVREKIRIMRACGYFLLLINMAISAMAFILIYDKHSVEYHEITVITIATYTFASFTLAIINVVKHSAKKDCFLFCIKIIQLISASGSLITLTNTMLSTFGENNETFRKVILTTLSGAVSVFLIIGAIYMIRKSHFYLRTMDNEKERE